MPIVVIPIGLGTRGNPWFHGWSAVMAKDCTIGGLAPGKVSPEVLQRLLSIDRGEWGQGWPAAVVGHFSADRAEVLVRPDGTCRALPQFGVDELAKG